MNDAPAKKMGFTHDDKNNTTQDWYTPAYLFDAISLEFDLDPCQPEQKVPWVPAKRHYWKELDGLRQPWEGSVWLNPPYGPDTPKWLAKMATHGNGMALVFARTDTIWFHEAKETASAMLFLKGRIKFVDGLGKTGGGGAGCGSLLIAWGTECRDALWKMKQQGLFCDLNSGVAS